MYKLYSTSSPRYCEDIDLVQIQAAPIGAVLSEIRNILTPWLGEPRLKQGQGRVTATYRFQTEGSTAIPAKLKIEINTREHFSVMGCTHKKFAATSPWFAGEALIATYHLEEEALTMMQERILPSLAGTAWKGENPDRA